jgi:hypothetical protein
MTISDARYYDVHGLLKISVEGNKAKNLKFLEAFGSSRLASEPDVELHLGSFSNPDISQMQKVGRFILGDKLLFEHRKFGKILLKDLLGEAKIFISTGYSYFRPIHVLILNAMWYHLMHRGHATFVHSACVSNNDDGILINAWLGGGKTISTIRLVQAGLSFLADDTVIVSKDGYAHSFPAPLKLSSPHAKLIKNIGVGPKFKIMLGEFVRKIPLIRRRVEIVYRPFIEEILPHAKVVNKSPIRHVLMLRKAQHDEIRRIVRDRAVNILSSQNQWERIFWTDRIFIPYSFSDPSFNLTSLHVKEREILHDALKDAECYELCYGRFATDIVEKFLLKR